MTLRLKYFSTQSLSFPSIQKPKQPKWNNIVISTLNIIYRQISVFHPGDLPGVFGFSTHFQDNLLIDEEI